MWKNNIVKNIIGRDVYSRNQNICIKCGVTQHEGLELCVSCYKAFKYQNRRHGMILEDFIKHKKYER